MENRVAIFIEGKSFHRGYRTFAGDAMIHFPKLSRWLSDYVDSELCGAYYYTALDESESRLRDFLNMVASKEGYFVQSYPRHYQNTMCYGCKGKISVQTDKFVDIALATDIIHLASLDAFDVVILLTNDPAHAHILSVVQMMGKQTWVASWDNVCQELQQVSFGSIVLKNVFDHFSTEKRDKRRDHDDDDKYQDHDRETDDEEEPEEEANDDSPADEDEVEEVPEFPEEEYIPKK